VTRHNRTNAYNVNTEARIDPPLSTEILHAYTRGRAEMPEAVSDRRKPRPRHMSGSAARANEQPVQFTSRPTLRNADCRYRRKANWQQCNTRPAWLSAFARQSLPRRDPAALEYSGQERNYSAAAFTTERPPLPTPSVRASPYPLHLMTYPGRRLKQRNARHLLPDTQSPNRAPTCFCVTSRFLTAVPRDTFFPPAIVMP